MSEIGREYLRRLGTVLDYIEANLEGDLSLNRLSEKAHYSPFHFHRMFLTVVGERVNEYTHRKRIERIASVLLVDDNIPLKELAYQYGFNSNNSFSRAFKKYYGVSPTAFKTEGNLILSKIGISPFSSYKYICSIDNLNHWTEMNAQLQVKELPELKLASISQIGGFEKIGSMYKKLMDWGSQQGVLDVSNFKTVTLYHDNPNVTQISKVRFSACVTINKDISSNEEIRPLTLQKGIYAVGRFEIKGEEIPKGWESVCAWVLESNLEFRDGHYFEIYHNDHRSHPEQKFILDICVPLERTDQAKRELTKVNRNNDRNNNINTRAEPLGYHQLIDCMKEIRANFFKGYGSCFKLGNIYLGNPGFSYFSLTTEKLKVHKLKFVIVLDHRDLCFSICLSGQNKNVRKKYWEIFKGSDWDQFHVVESIDKSLSIIDQIILKNPDFRNKINLIEQIEVRSLKFIDEIRSVLEY